MKVLNVHQRELATASERVGLLIDSLSSPQDELWPRHLWPRMQFDRPLEVGAQGGHGPIRYVVENYTPGRSIRFRFTGPQGFDGYHAFEIISVTASSCVLRHSLEMTTHGPALLSWPIVFRPLHDALIEDSLALAQAALGEVPRVKPWSPWVKLLRGLVTKGRARSQTTPRITADGAASNAVIPGHARPVAGPAAPL